MLWGTCVMPNLLNQAMLERDSAVEKLKHSLKLNGTSFDETSSTMTGSAFRLTGVILKQYDLIICIEQQKRQTRCPTASQVVEAEMPESTAQ